MAQYYYFIVSLPNLSLNMSEPPSLEGVWSSSEAVVKEDDRQAMRALLDDTAVEEVGIAAEWHRFDHDLRHAISHHRSIALGRSCKDHFHGKHHQVEIWHILQGLWTHKNPLEREFYLIDQVFSMLGRWSSGYGPFGREVLMIYLLQLKLIHRASQFKQVAGEENFERIYISLKDKILNNDRGIL